MNGTTRSAKSGSRRWAGRYQVYARWPADANRGANATYTVTHQAEFQGQFT